MCATTGAGHRTGEMRSPASASLLCFASGRLGTCGERTQKASRYVSGTPIPTKARGNDEGFALLERSLGDADMLFLRRDCAEPLVVVSCRVWGAAVVVNFAPFASSRRKIGFPGERGCTPSQGGAGSRSKFYVRRKFLAGGWLPDGNTGGADDQ
jgi:hypothetical protein